MSKTCALCHEHKPLDDFYCDQRMKDGRMWRCKICVKAKQSTYNLDRNRKAKRNKEWARDNRDKRTVIEARWRAKNHAKVLEYKRRYRERHPTAWHDWYLPRREQVLEWNRANYDPARKRARRNPDQSRRDRERRRARLSDAFVEDVYFENILLRDLGECGICGKHITEPTIELDHILPLAAGGMHEHANVQLAHLTCNRRKGSKVGFDLRDAA